VEEVEEGVGGVGGGGGRGRRRGVAGEGGRRGGAGGGAEVVFELVAVGGPELDAGGVAPQHLGGFGLGSRGWGWVWIEQLTSLWHVGPKCDSATGDGVSESV
jgi:hypothetical protein